MSTWKQQFKLLTADSIIAATFISPSMIIICALAGISFGYSMIWTIILATAINIALQEMYLRFGLINGGTLTQSLRASIHNKFLRLIVSILLLYVIISSALSYIVSNIVGIYMSLSSLLSELNPVHLMFGIVVVLICAVLIELPDIIWRIMIVLLVIVSGLLVLTAATGQITWGLFFEGVFLPSVNPEEFSWVYVALLLGAMVLPYQLFVGCTAAKERWQDESHLTAARVNLFWTAIFTGFIGICILVCGTLVQRAQRSSATATDETKLFQTLDTFIGTNGSIIMAIVLCLTGLCSTVLIVASFSRFIQNTYQHSIKWKKVLIRLGFCVGLIGCGGLVLVASSRPLSLLFLMVLHNVLLLPFCCLFLMIMLNRKNMAQYRNGALSNGILVLILAMSGLVCQQAVLFFSTDMRAIILYQNMLAYIITVLS